ncbi:MAG: pimeloyl-ACP methyl ester carboxylesterase [Nitriliruptoraceae bacterium]
MNEEHVVERTLRLRAVPDGPEGSLSEVRVRRIHGYDRAYRRAGEGHGETVVLLHGVGDSSVSWAPVMAGLAKDHDVIAPDLLGHGQSDKPRADYSLGAFANGMRDLLGVLEVERATIVGHSLGAGVAMQLAYQYPALVERLVLVSAGGVSRSVSPLLRAATLPLAPTVLGLLEMPGIRRAVHTLVRAVARPGTDLGAEAEDVLRVLDCLPDSEARMAFTRTLRGVVDTRGQIVTALDRSYLVRDTPTLIVWGTKDPIIPAHHAQVLHASLPGSQLELFQGAGHFPHRADPQRFMTVLRRFVTDAPAGEWSADRWRDLLAAGRYGPGVHPSLAGR